MKEVLMFLESALPWIAIGLFLACSFVTVNAKKTGSETGRFFRAFCWIPAACFLFVAIMELLDGNTSSGTTWLVLGVFNAMVNYANTQNKENKD